MPNLNWIRWIVPLGQGFNFEANTRKKEIFFQHHAIRLRNAINVVRGGASYHFGCCYYSTDCFVYL
jgi:hypothetical protein